jgi:hypothetical protein
MGIQSHSYAVLDFGRLGPFGRADAVRVGVSQPLLSLCQCMGKQTGNSTKPTFCFFYYYLKIDKAVIFENKISIQSPAPNRLNRDPLFLDRHS